jgi:cyclopropane fatty-acyl-phospholipid synthase-like methyltransferase
MDFEKIYTDGRYFESNPTWSQENSEWKGAMIEKLLKKNAIHFNELVEVGCGVGKILAYLQKQNPAKNFIGYDISPQAIELALHIKNDKLHFLQSDFIEAYKEIADVLLIIDVVEHVADYYGFLNKLKPKSKYFIFHIPIDMSINTVLKPHINLQQRDAVGHIHYFTKDSIFWMLEDCGYKIMDWHYTKPDYDFKPVKGLKLSIKKILRNITFSISEKWADRIWGNYSVMILAQQ